MENDIDNLDFDNLFLNINNPEFNHKNLEHIYFIFINFYHLYQKKQKTKII